MVTQFGISAYGGTECSGAIYGVASDHNGQIGGSIADVQEWVGRVELTSNVIIQDQAAVVISCDATVVANGYIIIVQDGGYLNTRAKRLPKQSSIGSTLIIT